jgi:RNA polymerase sigma-70 factor (ECF subfamily)
MNEADLERLYSRLETPVYNVVYRWVWDREEARDLVQEAFVRLWKMRRRVVAETVEPLVYRMALNLARSSLRRRKLRRFVGIGALVERLHDPREQQATLETSEQSARLRQAVLALPEDLRQVIMLCAFTELRYDQIGEILRIPEGTVGSRRNRALKRLRGILSGESVAERTG